MIHERAHLVDRIAATFTAKLVDELGDTRMETVVQRNLTEESPNVCHSHDFCDANVVMADAFSEETGHDVDFEDGGHIDLWNEAWELARGRRFKAELDRRRQ
jgi:hypothetical protein